MKCLVGSRPLPFEDKTGRGVKGGKSGATISAAAPHFCGTTLNLGRCAASEAAMRTGLSVVGLMLAGCGSVGTPLTNDAGSVDAGQVDAGVPEGQLCFDTRPCAAGLVCENSRCQRPCTNLDGLCSDGALCSRVFTDGGVFCLSGGAGVPGAECRLPTDCGKGLRCVRRGTTGPFRCIQGCNTAEAPSCAEGQACSTFTGSTAGFCEPRASLGADCIFDNDCGGGGLTCSPPLPRGACTRSCTTTSDCGPKGACLPIIVNGVRTGGQCERTCTDTSECRIADAWVCKSAAFYCASAVDPQQCEAALGQASACGKL